MKYLSVCSGMEAASVAWHPLGWTPVAFSEIEPFPSAILKHHFSKPNYPYDIPNLGDLNQYRQWPLSTGDVDIIVGGPPCQAFSVAGLRRGLDDPRGNLTLTYLGLVDKLRPKWVVYENVPGLLSVNGGSAFGSFLGGLAELGYSAAWRVLDAQYVGSCRLHPHERGQSAVPQRRRRVFVVAVRGAGNWQLAAEVLSIAEGMRGHTPSRRKKGQGAAASIEGGVDANGLQRTVGTLCADTHPGAYSGQDAYTGRLIPDQKPVVIDRAAFNQGQNAQYEPHIEETEVMDSLVARGPHAVGQPLPIAFTQNQREELRLLGDVAGAVSASGGTHQTNYLAQPIPFRKSKRAQSTTDDESWVPADVTNTLNNFDLGDTRTTHAVVEPKIYENHAQDSRVNGPLDVAPTVAAKYGTGGGNVPLVGAMAVRRLTPVECERLQGFPDNWSRIPWKGKPETECPDGPRYKACGNSMAVPCMFWIGKRIAEVEAKYACNKANA